MKHWRVRHRLVFEVIVQAEDEASALATARAVERACLPDAAHMVGDQRPVPGLGSLRFQPAGVIDRGWSALPVRAEGEVEIRKRDARR